MVGNPFVFSAAGSLVGPSPVETEAVLRSNPEAVQGREASASAYEGLSASQAEGVLNGSFGGLVSEQDGGPPALGSGVSVTGFPSNFGMSLLLPEGHRAVVDSLLPIAIDSPSGRVPLDLGLNAGSNGFEGRAVLAPVHLPLRVEEGSSLTDSDVSLTPVAGNGSPLSGAEGRVDGSSVFYGDTEDQEGGVYDVDSLFKLSTYGFSENMVLRSQRAPQDLYFRVGLPADASLRMSGDGSVQIVDAGSVVAAIETPHAQDAEGFDVPVAMSVSQDTLIVSVPHTTGQYHFPIFVDPTVVERGRTGNESAEVGYTWGFYTPSSAFKGGNYEILEKGAGHYGLEDEISSSVGAGESAFFYYPTQGESRIYEVTASTEYSGYAGNHFENLLGIYNVNSKVKEGEQEWIESYKASSTICALAACAAGTVTHGVNDKSEVFYTQIAREAGALAGGTSKMSSAAVYINQEKGPSASFLPLEEWIKAGNQFSVKLDASDPGLGLSSVSFKSPSAPSWKASGADGFAECDEVQCEECYSETSCELRAMTLNTTGLPDGEDTVVATVEDPVHLSETAKTTVKIDSTPPHNIGLSGLGPGGQIGSGEYQLKAEATDGSGSTPSSGMKSLRMTIDGREVANWSTPCSPGPCKAAGGTLPIFGHNYATGRHTITITAEDQARNVSSESFPMIVNPAGTVALGPGSFNPQSGQYSMSATDVSMGGGLTVRRSYSSEHPTAGVGGPLGAQWAISLGGQESLVTQPTGAMVLTDASGAQTIFAPNGTGGYISPAGDSNLTLSSTPCEAGQTEFSLKNSAADTTTCFKVPSGGSGEILTPHITRGQVATDTVTYAYETVEVPVGSKNMVTRPREALAPVPAGVSCSPTLKIGCRELTFKYATSTTAKGEAPTEWGAVEGNLAQVHYTAWEPTSREMKDVVVADYEYDKQGRLRVVWDPRVKPEPLKTYYGYDGDGHVTAITPPGQETLGILYGTIAGSANPGAVLKVTQASPSTALWSGEGLANTEAPKLTGVRTTGVRMAITEGKWSGNPIVYGYQWEDCTGSECVPIVGATNANYTPTSKDEHKRLAVLVTATNGSGSSSVTVYEPLSAPTYTSSFGSFGGGNGQLREPEGGLAVDGAGNVWAPDTYNDRLEEFNSKGEFVRAVGSDGTGAGQMEWPMGVTIDSKGNVWATDELNDRVQEFNSEGTFIKMFGWGVANGESKLQTCTSSCRAGLQGSGSGEFNVPEGIVVDSKGDVFVADRGNHRVQEFNSELAWVRNMVQPEEHEGPFYLTLDANNNIWVAYSWDNKIGEFNSEGKQLRTWGTAGSEAGKLSDPYGVAVGVEGDIWVSEYGNDRVQVFTPTGEYLYGFGGKGNGAGQFNEAPHGLAFAGSSVYVLDSGVWWENTGNSRIEKWTIPSPKESEGELRAAQPGSTVEYNVPVSGGGAPHAMGTKEVEEGWAQKDLPSEATAVFPPDEPEGWPAGDYKRATIYYRDSTERTVNVASPSGGISTSEYNATNDVVRSLSPDNRAIALKEAKPAVVAKELDTQSEYGGEGTELLSTLGPRHAIKLANGEEVQARSHTVYEYDDEEAPAEGGPYRLVTKTTQGAEIEGKGEQEVRTTLTGYSGQGGLGWKLRKPTSTTTNPGGLNLTRTTVYEESTGNVLETTTPGSNKLPNTPPTYTSSFGSFGSSNGQLREPEGGLAVDGAGNVWAPDTYNDRLEEFNSKGEFVRAVGSDGTGAGQMEWPMGVTIDSKGNVWATDELNNRVQEFNSEGTFMKMFGWGVANGENKLQTCTSSCRAGLQGSGSGEFNVPEGIVVDSKGDVFVADRGNHRVQEFNSELSWVRNMAQSVEHEGPFYLTLDGNNNIWVAYSWDDKIGEYNSEGKLLRTWGTAGSEPGKLSDPYGVAVGVEGDVWVPEYGNNRVQVFTPSGEYLYGFGAKGNGAGQFNEAPHGLAFSGSSVYVLDSGVFWENSGNSRIEKWTLPNKTKNNVNDTQTIYYTTAANSKYTKCGEHPEWASWHVKPSPPNNPTPAVCQAYPITSYTYNMYGEPTQIKAEVARAGGGTDTRTTTTTYDEAGRPETTETTSTVGHRAT